MVNVTTKKVIKIFKKVLTRPSARDVIMSETKT